MNPRKTLVFGISGLILLILLGPAVLVGAGRIVASLTAGLTPSIRVADQDLMQGNVTIARVVSPGPGWVVIRRDDGGHIGPVVGETAVRPGLNLNVTVDVGAPQASSLYAELHTDAGQVGVYEFPGPDVPLWGRNSLVLAAFQVGAQGKRVTPTPGETGCCRQTRTPVPTVSLSATPSPTATRCCHKTRTPTPTVALSATPSPTATRCCRKTPTPTETPSPLPTSTSTPLPTNTSTPVPTVPVVTATPIVITATPSPLPTNTATPVPTVPVVTATPIIITATPSPLPTNTSTPVPTVPVVTATPIVITATPSPTQIPASPTATAIIITATPSPTQIVASPTAQVIVVTNTPTPGAQATRARPTPGTLPTTGDPSIPWSLVLLVVGTMLLINGIGFALARRA